MPLRISPFQGLPCCRSALRQARATSTPTPSLVTLFSGLVVGSTTTRHASILANLSDNKGAYNKRIRVGRGPSSGKGKTSGRGHKGQKQHGKVKPWFQGGQTPLVVQRGTMGFENRRAPDLAKVNVSKLQEWIDAGRIDPSKRITIKELVESNLVGRPKDGIKLLGGGGEECLRQPVDILISRASASAIQYVEAAGGKITTRFYNRLAIRRILEGKSENTDKPLPVGAEHVAEYIAEARKKGFPYRLPDPTSRKDIEYYRDPAHRGYLSHLLKPGESPSLYFKVPTAPAEGTRGGKTQKRAKKEDALW